MRCLWLHSRQPEKGRRVWREREEYTVFFAADSSIKWSNAERLTLFHVVYDVSPVSRWVSGALSMAAPAKM